MKVPKNLLAQFIPYGNTVRNWPQVIAIIIACMGSLNLGALFCWPSPSIPILISNSSHLDPISLEEASYFSVIPPSAAIIAAPFVAILNDVIGRKKTVMLIAVPQFLAWILIATATNVYQFYVARLLAGIGEALLFGTLPTFVGEIALPNVRGSWGNMVTIGIYIGQFFVNLIGAFCDIRTTAAIFACLPVLHLLLMTLLPESPYFLLMKEREQEARESLQQLRWVENVEKELNRLKSDVKRQISENGSFRNLIVIPVNRKALLISIANRGCQQLSGLAAFAVYTQYIFNQAGGNIPASISAISFTGTLVTSISAFAFIVDRFGRKKLMMFSTSTCCIVLAIIATYFYIDQQTSIDTSSFKWVPLTGMLSYIVLCSSGIGLIPTLMLGELFSASIKAKALCVLNICFAVYVLGVSKLYQVLSSNFGMFVPFYVFSFCCLMGAIFSYCYIPETKGKTLEEIQQLLSKGRCHEEDSEMIEKC